MSRRRELSVQFIVLATVWLARLFRLDGSDLVAEACIRLQEENESRAWGDDRGSRR